MELKNVSFLSGCIIEKKALENDPVDYSHFKKKEIKIGIGLDFLVDCSVMKITSSPLVDWARVGNLISKSCLNSGFAGVVGSIKLHLDSIYKINTNLLLKFQDTKKIFSYDLSKPRDVIRGKS